MAQVWVVHTIATDVPVSSIPSGIHAADPKTLPLDTLVQVCEQEIQQFRARQTTDAKHCYELFQRALGQDNRDAFDHVYQLYRPQVDRWVRSHRMFSASSETSPDPFVSEAFMRLHKHLSGPKFEGFRSVDAILAYLKACAVTALLEDLRKTRRANAEMPLSDHLHDEEPGPAERASAGQIWGIVQNTMRDETDRRLIDLRFRLGLTPAEIATRHPAQWRNAREVSVSLQRCLRQLARHRELQELLG